MPGWRRGRRRVQAGRDDPSDATRAVLLGKREAEPGEIGWRRIDAARGLEAIVAEIAMIVTGTC